MHSKDYVIQYMNDLKAQGLPSMDILWKTGLACVGWPYIFGALGQECTPAYRRKAYASKGAEHPTIKSACKNFDGAPADCKGCKWYPEEKRVMSFDCRGYTRKLLEMVYGWTLQGGGCTSQWNTASNWKAKGTIDTIPEDTLVCLFYPNKKNPKIMDHTGFGYKGETLECSNGVQHFMKRNKKWTHWAIPACVDASVTPPDPSPAPTPGTDKPTLRRGDKGPYVTLLQTELLNRGYALPKYGADGSFGHETETAVKQFQSDNELAPDGIVGPKTWEALDAAPVKQPLYTVVIPHRTREEAETLLVQYPGEMKPED